MLYVARVDRAHDPVSLEDFLHLSPLSVAHRHGIWRTLQSRRWQALLDLLDAFQCRDPETWSHCQRVQQYALDLAAKIKLNASEMHSLRLAALVHDIGKMAVSDTLLSKQSPLTSDEYSTIRLHAEIGEKLIHPLVPHSDVLAGIRHHHERMDGEGYPDRLIGPHIPLHARIIAVVDVFDALTHVRPYRRNLLTPLEALEVLEAQTQGQLDPDLVVQFCQMVRSTMETVVEVPCLKQ
jgi:putative two-component system response regulator